MRARKRGRESALERERGRERARSREREGRERARERERARARERERRVSDLKFTEAVKMCRNGERANVNQCITWVHADILDKKMSAVPHATVVLVNMPYGKRLQTTQVLYLSNSGRMHQ